MANTIKIRKKSRENEGNMGLLVVYANGLVKYGYFGEEMDERKESLEACGFGMD